MRIVAPFSRLLEMTAVRLRNGVLDNNMLSKPSLVRFRTGFYFFEANPFYGNSAVFVRAPRSRDGFLNISCAQACAALPRARYLLFLDLGTSSSKGTCSTYSTRNDSSCSCSFYRSARLGFTLDSQTNRPTEMRASKVRGSCSAAITRST